MFQEEFQQLDKTGVLAAACLREGKIKEAKRHLSKLRRSPFVTEAKRAEAQALLGHYKEIDDGAKARHYIRMNLSYLWGAPELLSSSNFINPPATSRSKLYRIQFTGATVTIGTFSVFDERYICTFEAIAQTATEALDYFLELIPVDDVRTMRVIKIDCSKSSPGMCRYEGVVKAHPFRTASNKELARRPLIDTKKYLPEGVEDDIPVPSRALSAIVNEMMSGSKRGQDI